MNSADRISPGWIGLSFFITTSMVVDDLDIVRIAVAPCEAETPVVVDPYAVLPPSIALQRFEAVA
jgi:hypothetical protein